MSRYCQVTDAYDQLGMRSKHLNALTLMPIGEGP
jgi:hypothetical protein